MSNLILPRIIIFRFRFGTWDKSPDSKAIYKYWGPKEYLSLSGRKLKNLYREGKIGKTHEINREGRVLHRHWEVYQMHDYQKNPRKNKKN